MPGKWSAPPAYSGVRRFGCDRWYKFVKQRLHWTLPNLRTPEQSERWSDLMPPRSWQLWLARDLVVQNVLLQAICYNQLVVLHSKENVL